MGISIEPLRPGDREARHMLGRQAFGHTRPYMQEWDLPDDEIIGVYDSEDLIAATVLLEGGHWFGGRPVAGPGLSGVAVAPHRRGTGVARPMLEHVVRVLHDRGAAVSGLYPTAAGYYRAAGWELAGDWITRQLPVEAFSASARADADVTMFEIDDLPTLAPSYDALARQGSGHVVRGDRWWWHRQRITRQAHADNQGYLIRACVGDAAGYLTLRSVSSDRRILDLWIDDIGAEDGAVLRALGGQIARFGTVAGLIKTTQPSWILESLTAEGQRWTATESFGWMLRIVDVERAFAQRGWPPIDAELTLTVADPILDVNTGTFTVSFGNGEASVQRTDAPGVSLSIQALSSWFSGWRSATQLAFLGQLSGADAQTIGHMDALAAGPTPICPEFY